MQALDDFKSRALRALVATDIAQRGLDVEGISYVINYDVPQQPEDYVHRIGRTGRAATTGDAYTFMSAEEIGMVRTIERTIGQEIPRISVPGFDFGTVAEKWRWLRGDSLSDFICSATPTGIFET